MPSQALNQIGELLREHQERILNDWLRDQSALSSRRGVLSQAQNRKNFLLP